MLVHSFVLSFFFEMKFILYKVDDPHKSRVLQCESPSLGTYIRKITVDHELE